MTDPDLTRGRDECEMFHEPPMDFAYCETHDTTFPLGGTCKFQGREMWEVYAEEADEQRGLKVRAEMELAELTEELAAVQEWAEPLTRQTCPSGIHADYHVDTEDAWKCPWCELATLRARVVEECAQAVEAVEGFLEGHSWQYVCAAAVRALAGEGGGP